MEMSCEELKWTRTTVLSGARMKQEKQLTLKNSTALVSSVTMVGRLYLTQPDVRRKPKLEEDATRETACAASARSSRAGHADPGREKLKDAKRGRL